MSVDRLPGLIYLACCLISLISASLCGQGACSWSGVGGGTNQPALSLRTWTDASGATALYAGGQFTIAGGAFVARVARWDGTAWSAVGGGLMGGVEDLEGFDDGTGPALYAGGWLGSLSLPVMRWDGSSWSPVGVSLGGGWNPAVHELSILDIGFGEALFAAGRFTVAGGAPASGVAVWSGAAWVPLATGLLPGTEVHSLAMYDDGLGSALYAGTQSSGVVRWDGATWSSVGSGLLGFGAVRALQVFDDGAGPRLYAAHDSGQPVSRWDGTSWTSVGTWTGWGGARFSVLGSSTAKRDRSFLQVGFLPGNFRFP